MNLKEGIKRILLACGYTLFIIISTGIASNEGNYFITIFGAVLGFFLFKGLCTVISWLIAGFKNEDINIQK